MFLLGSCLEQHMISIKILQILMRYSLWSSIYVLISIASSRQPRVSFLSYEYLTLWFLEVFSILISVLSKYDRVRTGPLHLTHSESSQQPFIPSSIFIMFHSQIEIFFPTSYHLYSTFIFETGSRTPINLPLFPTNVNKIFPVLRFFS